MGPAHTAPSQKGSILIGQEAHLTLKVLVKDQVAALYISSVVVKALSVQKTATEHVEWSLIPGTGLTDATKALIIHHYICMVKENLEA